MNEWTEQEEQEIIERAKTGDPEANYALSLWALRRGEEEPDEPRWNRLAAKCLVKAAQAGYGPAKEQMAALLAQGDPSGAARKNETPAAPAPTPAPTPTAVSRKAPAAEDDEEDVPAEPRPRTPVRRSATARPTAAPVKRAAPRRQRVQEEEDDGFDTEQASWDDGYDDEPPARRGRRGAGRNRDEEQDEGRGWADDKWRKMEIICVAVCAVLLVVIAIMILTGKRGDSKDANPNSAIPPAGEVAGTNDAGGTVAGDYPDEATKAAIMAADLGIQPAPEDYVTEPTSGTVSVSSEYLRLRKGPNTTYDPIAQMPNGTAVSVFATKNDWDLILYQSDEGPVYGWCSSEYVILTAGAAGAAASDQPGTVEG